MHRQFYVNWVDTIVIKEDSYRKKLMAQLEILYQAAPHVQTTFQDRTVGEAHHSGCRIQTKKMTVLILDLRLTATVLVARAVLVN